GGRPEGVSMHYYEGGEDPPLHFTEEHVKKQLAIFSRVEDAIVQQRSLFDSYRDGRKIALVLDEWGVWDRIPEEDEKKYGKLWQQSTMRSEEHTSELQSPCNLVCRLLLEKKKTAIVSSTSPTTGTSSAST